VSVIGLTDPALIRLDVDSKLSEQLKVSHSVVLVVFPLFCVFNEEKSNYFIFC